MPQPTQFQPLWIKFLDSFLSELFYAARSTHFIYISDCPCELFCPQGCIDCYNPVCQEVATVLVFSTYSYRNKPMTVDFNGKNYHSDFYIKTIFNFYIKEMLMTVWYLNMVKVQMSKEVVELLWWEKCGILVEVVLRSDKYESFISIGFKLLYSGM